MIIRGHALTGPALTALVFIASQFRAGRASRSLSSRGTTGSTVRKRRDIASTPTRRPASSAGLAEPSRMPVPGHLIWAGWPALRHAIPKKRHAAASRRPAPETPTRSQHSSSPRCRPTEYPDLSAAAGERREATDRPDRRVGLRLSRDLRDVGGPADPRLAQHGAASPEYLCIAVLHPECSLMPPSVRTWRGSRRVCGNLCACAAAVPACPLRHGSRTFS
jgi:hypothetical protein